jgi:hypothetical protein
VQKKAIAAKQILHGLRLVFIPDSSENAYLRRSREGARKAVHFVIQLLEKLLVRAKKKIAKDFDTAGECLLPGGRFCGILQLGIIANVVPHGIVLRNSAEPGLARVAGSAG